LASSIMNLSVSSQYRGKGIMGELVNRIHKASQSFFSLVVPNGEAIKGYLKKDFYPMSMAFMIRPVRLSNYFYDRQVAKGFLRPFDLIWKKKKLTSKFNIQEHQSMFDGRFDELFSATHNQYLIRQVRDSKFLNWRYRTNPRRKYITFTATADNGKIEGYITIKIMKIFGKTTGLIIDLLTDNNPSAGGLITAALNYFWINCVSVAMVACFPKSREYGLLKKEGFLLCPKRFRPHPLTLCLKASGEGQNKSSVLIESNNWFFMFGDYETF
jgi:hypothetical protein